MNFKSCKPKRYSKSETHPDLSEICANCGYSNGDHYTPASNNYKDTCPNKEQIELISVKPKFFKTRKLSAKELLKRKFKKFLYDNNALEEWTRLRKKDSESDKSFYEHNAYQYVSGAFMWSKEDYNRWSTLSSKWKQELKSK